MSEQFEIRRRPQDQSSDEEDNGTANPKDAVEEQVNAEQVEEVKADAAQDSSTPAGPVYVSGTFECVSKDTIETFKSLFQPIVAKSHKEKGCLRYNLYQDKTNECIFSISEEWASQEDLDAHNNAAHLAPLKSDAFQKVATAKVNYCNAQAFLGKDDPTGMTIPTMDIFSYNPDAENPLERVVKPSTKDIFSGKKVVVFAVPGAFTPTCQEKQAPTFVEKFDELTKMGVDAVYCLAINDPFVAQAFVNKVGGEGKLRVIADFDGSFCNALGNKTFDASAFGLGIRPLRFSFYAVDGVIEQYFQEEDPIQMTNTGAETLINAINLQASFQ